MSALLLSCQSSSLEKIDEETLIQMMVNNEMPDPSGVTIKDEQGNIITLDSLKILENTGAYAEDFYQNKAGEVTQVVVRKKTAADDQFYKKLYDAFNPPIELNEVKIDCSNLPEILTNVYNRDQDMRKAGASVDPEIDRENLEIVVSILEQCGMPSLDVVGPVQLSGLWAVLQHAPPGYQSKFLPILKKSAQKGDLEWSLIALMKDRALMYEGKPQIYGSQISDGKLYDLFEPEYVNQRRASVGLGPLEEYVTRFGLEFNIPQKQK